MTAEEVKRLAKLVKDQKFKVTAAIQGDALELAAIWDELQTVIQFLKSSATDLELQFTNFRE